MADEKITINWDELQGRRVDTRLREQDAMERNRAYAQADASDLPVSTTTVVPSVWNNAILMMTLFGLAGGVLAWGARMLIDGPLKSVVGHLINYQPDARAEANRYMQSIEDIEARRLTGRYDDATAQSAVDDVKVEGRHNRYFRLLDDKTLSDKQREVRLHDLEESDRVAGIEINTLGYGLCGMMIALCLAIAEPMMNRKRKAALINGFAGAVLGLIGGAAAALLNDRISAFAGSVTQSQQGWVREMATNAAIWGMLGLFLGLASGLVLLNLKKSTVGIVGGLLGGIIGGLLYAPAHRLSHIEAVGWLVALLAIGVVSGLMTGLLEDAVKAGWLKVTSGIISGKQFILYRNPTYIGSSPDCQIYLFKDPQVGKRHAAIHLLATGIEIEDLPLGSPTRINGKPVARAKLRSGDTIQIGSTSFQFNERRPASR